MTQTHTSYEFSKRLKAFLGEGAVEPMEDEYYDATKQIARVSGRIKHEHHYPAYQLHDLLSKPFCEAFRDKVFLSDSVRFKDLWTSREMGQILAMHYFDGGLPAVEACLMKMIGGK